jgi:hypothetical protein
VFATRRYKTVIPAVIVLAVLIMGIVAMRSQGNDDGPLETVDRTTNCPPVARPDVAATRPNEAVLIDALANDNDPEGDELVFQILSATGGDATLDDAGTPTDSADDRVNFTPDDPPVAESVVKYQALDTQGSFSESSITIYVNPEATAPAGAVSAPLEPLSEEGCGTVDETSTSTTLVAPVEPIGPTVTTPSDERSTTSVSLKAGSRTTTTRKGTGKTTTTTTKKPSNNTTTTRDDTPPPTQPPATTSTTRKPSTPPTTRPGCPDPTKDKQGFIDCQKGTGPTTSTTVAP